MSTKPNATRLSSNPTQTAIVYSFAFYVPVSFWEVLVVG